MKPTFRFTTRAVVRAVLEGKNGSQSVRNSQGKPFLAGYAFEPSSGWGIISQTPIEVVNEPVQAYLRHMVKLALPFFLLVLLFSWLFSSFIAYPLHRLAKFSEHVHLDRGNEIPFPTIGSSIYEMRHLQRSIKMAVQEINRHLKELNIEIETDALTGLANRRTFNLVLEKWTNKGTPFSLIIIDVDHFKQVNDTFGHITGDAVLKFVATTMLQISRQEDVCFRYGGEEFGIFVQSGDDEAVQEIAERLRRTVKNTISPTGKPITISLGIATYPVHAVNPIELISHADEALYQSKTKGRNQTTVYDS
jgi:diguanylate cyclase (GGDEF)-like protein